MAMGKIDTARLETMLAEEIDRVLAKADAAGIDHPYWTSRTAELMAQAAMTVVKACELPQDDDAA